MDVTSVIRDILSAQVELPADDAAPLALKSFELVVVAEEMERRFGIQVKAVELVPENFGSTSRIVEYVERARARKPR